MKTPYHTLGIKYSIEHDRKCNKVKCTVTVDPEWPVFCHWGKTILHKRTYTNSRTFRCKPKQLENMLHCIIAEARKRFRRLVRTQSKFEDLSEYNLSISTTYYWIEKKQEIED